MLRFGFPARLRGQLRGGPAATHDGPTPARQATPTGGHTGHGVSSAAAAAGGGGGNDVCFSVLVMAVGGGDRGISLVLSVFLSLSLVLLLGGSMV